MKTLTESALSGDRLALTRLLTQVENDTPESRYALVKLFSRAGKAHLVGVTGAPGTGKSSLVNQLALQFRAQDKRVAILAVDPSSPFTGGAVLGDRVRMRDLAGDPGVFIRSMASRGSLGGLAQATAGLVQVFDAAGFEIVIIETVGAGQSEVDIARLAHTTLVIEAPGLGDDIQAIKAGILEIADILVVNKADRPGVENTLRSLRNALELGHPVRHVFHHHAPAGAEPPAEKPAYNSWIPPIYQTVATTGQGVPELAVEIARHAEHLRQSGDWIVRERNRLKSELETLLGDALLARFYETVPPIRYKEVLEMVFQRSMAPWDAVKILLNGWLR